MPPDTAYRRPDRLDARIVPDPAHREPLPLATRRGIGFGMQSLLPGAELVHEQVRAVIANRHGALSGGRRADWAQADLDLSTWFSRPALEGDLPAVMAGIDRSITVGGRQYHVSVQGSLRERIGGGGYEMTVNGRSMMAAGNAGHRNTEIGVQASAGGGVRLGRLPYMRFILGAWSLQGEYAHSVKNEFGGSAKSYRRTETTGMVDEHNYNIIYQVTVRPEGETAASWWIDRPGDVTARVVVPHEHRPQTPYTRAELRNAGRTWTRTRLPAGETVDFAAGGTSGVYPAFSVIPELPRLAAEMYAGVNGLPPGWVADPSNWPPAIRAMTRPDQLAAFFSGLAGRTGRIESLPPTRDGLKQSITIKLHALRPRHAGASETEIEQYAQGQRTHKHGTEHKVKGTHSFTAGPQFMLGSQADGHSSDPEGTPSGEQDHGPGGRVQAVVGSHVSAEYKTEKAAMHGNVDITRATYGGTAHTFRADPVFEVTLTRWRGSARHRRTRFLRVTDGMELMVPQRRLPDLGLSAPGVAPLAPAVPARHVPPGMIAGTSYPETLTAGGLMPRITDWLQERGIVRGFFPGTDRPNLVMREIDAAFSPEALRNQHTALLGSGVQRWIPVPRPFGGTRYVWIRVSAELGPATGQLPRPEVRLTLRGEAQSENHRSAGTAFNYGGAFEFRARGDGYRPDGVHRHGGMEVKGEVSGESTRGAEVHDRRLDIHRAGTREGSLEFQHPLRFRIEMGVSTEPPELLNVPVRGIREAVIGTGRLLGGNDPRAGDRWYTRRPFISHTVIEADAPDAVTGGIRLVVPEHVAVLDAPAAAPAPAFGGTPRWTPGRPATGRAGEAGRILADNLHPWGVPFASAVERWAALPATPYRRPTGPELAAPGAWHVPGLDFTTIAGQRYMHFTSPELIRPYLGDLLNNRYTLPVGSRNVNAGIEITAARPVGPADAPRFKGRNYTQESQADKAKSGSSRDFRLVVGPEGGGAAGDTTTQGLAGYEYGRDQAEEADGELGMTDEANQEATREYRHFVFDVDLILHGPRGTLRVPVPDGLYGMLPLEEAPGGGRRLVGDLENHLPGVFRRPVPPVRVPPPPDTAPAVVPEPPTRVPPPATAPAAMPDPPTTAPPAGRRGAAQGAALADMGLSVVHVPATGDQVVNALTNAATAEATAIGGTRPATPAELRGHLAETLTEDLARPPAERRFWAAIDERFGEEGGAAPTDERRRAAIALLTAPSGSASADQFTVIAAAAVLGLRITVVLPDGTSVVFGPESGRPVVLVRLPERGPFTGEWAATESAADSAPPAEAPASRGPDEDVPPMGVSPEDVPLMPLPPRRPSPPPAAPPGEPRRARRPVANLGADPFNGP
ncbi:hypothetical protein [Actinomadura darangshiensis]|uniref:hypothetical protein n=1 Tax=Actinomadura darangshiensis TaxID=705336 RepID=UPI001A9EA844|nr:hypothetical protein [Actinomadura darangshiensis]